MAITNLPSSDIRKYSYIIPSGTVAADSFEQQSATTIQNPDKAVKTLTGPFPAGTYRIPEQYYSNWVESITWTTLTYANQEQYLNRFPIYGMGRAYYLNLTTTLSSFKVYNTSSYLAQTATMSSTHYQMQYLDNKFWLTSIYGGLRTSTDGITWDAEVTLFSSYPHIRFASGETNKYVVFDGLNTSNSIYTSTNGITWTARTLPQNFQVRDIAHDGSTYILAGYASPSNFPYIYSSTDAVTWTQRYVNGTVGFPRKILYGAGEGRPYVVYGSNSPSSRLITSTDGITWTTSDASGIASYTEGVGGIYEGGSYYIWTNTNVRITSADGINWSSSGYTPHPENIVPVNLNKINTNEYVFSGYWGGMAQIYFTTSLTNFTNIHRIPLIEGRATQSEAPYNQMVAFNGAKYKYWGISYDSNSQYFVSEVPKGYFSTTAIANTPFVFEKIAGQAIIE